MDDNYWCLTLHISYNIMYYHLHLMFHSGFSFAYFVSRWPFARLKTTIIRFSTSGNTAQTPVRNIFKKTRKFVKPTFACFREIKHPRNKMYTVYVHERVIASICVASMMILCSYCLFYIIRYISLDILSVLPPMTHSSEALRTSTNVISSISSTGEVEFLIYCVCN